MDHAGLLRASPHPLDSRRPLGIHTTATALLGLVVFLVTGVLTWEDVLKETGAWDTLVWFSALVMMASFLTELGLIPWFSEAVGGCSAGTGG